MTMVSELWRHGAGELAELIATKQVTSVEVVNAHLDRIEQVNGQLNAIVRLLADEARAAAEGADTAVRNGEPLGPLHGVPFTVKENIDVAGTPTTSSLPILAGAIADRDAPNVERMRAAGGIPIGRTNLPDLGLRVATESSLHGTTINPWNPHVTAGGSSGGEASALASGMSPIGLGNDLGGSLRNPAHCCGVASIKPTVGRVPWATVVGPQDLGLAFQQMVVEGVMARRVVDVRLGLSIVAGQHRRDPLSQPVALVNSNRRRPLTVAVLAEPPGGATDAGIAGVVRAAADHLSDAGYAVVEATPPGYERIIELWQDLVMAEVRVQLPLLDLVMGADARRFLQFADETRPSRDLAEFLVQQTERFGLLRAWDSWLDDYQLILSPVWSQPAFPHGWDVQSAETAQATFELMRPILPANYLGLPAAVVPGGLANAMPVGVQVIGARWQELDCLDAAEVIERAVGVLTPIDPRLF
jgi:amidase